QLEKKIIQHLKNNKISFNSFEKDSILSASVYEIHSFSHSDSLINGVFPIKNIDFYKKNTNIRVRKGDFFIPTEQKGIKYLLETLEPQSESSFLHWNFLNNSLNYKIKTENDSISKIIYPIYRIEK
ncbi:MAG: peptidase M14, partial [Capnocytophaga sp.]|nr:peptidase M14 [Capnocytophaga sp.]